MPECSVCLEKEAKYTCPACDARTCSVECVKRHKLRTECTGAVDPAQFVANKDLTLSLALGNRDYNYLLRLERKIQLGKTDVKAAAPSVFKRAHNPMRNAKRQKPNDDGDRRLAQVARVFPNAPQTAVKRGNTLVVLLPPGMSRASQNKSGYDKKSASFTWTVEWAPWQQAGACKPILSFRVKETLSLREAFPVSVLAHNDNVSVEPQNLHFYLDNCINTSGRERAVIALNADATLAACLENKVVLEFPKIYVTWEPEVLTAFVQPESEAYGVESDSDSSSDESSDSESDSSDSDSDEAPEETSSRPPIQPEATLPQQPEPSMPMVLQEPEEDAEPPSA